MQRHSDEKSDLELPTLPNGARSAPRAARHAAPANESPATGASDASLANQSGVFAGRATGTQARSAAYELRREEAVRARAFAASIGALGVVALLAELVSGDPVLDRFVIGASMLVAIAAGADTWQRTRDPLQYTRGVGRRLAAAALLGTTVLTVRLGVLSPAPMLTTLAVAFFGLGDDRHAAYAFTALSSVAYVALAWVISANVVVDLGVIRASDASAGASFALIALVPAVHAAALWHARLSRRASIDAIARSNDWFREVRQREAQLEEANQDLDMLLKMSPGESAPYSGSRAGPYVLQERIGRGAMGEVYSAKHLESGSMAAVKLLQPSMQENPMLMERFQREGDAAAKLRGPNVVEIYELGAMTDGAPYLAMELLRGHDLGWHLRRRGQLSLDEVLSLVVQVASGLESARRAGVVHRDLKPQNLFLAQQNNAAPLWKILDFGVSRLAGSSNTLTKDVIVGTPGYMSPEQAAGTTASHRSDLFSFGAVVYRTLTGSPAFQGEDTPQTLYQVVYRNPPRPSRLAPGMPPDLDLVLAIALAKDPADRFDNAREMAAAFLDAAKSALDPRLRLQARTILAGLPWGTDGRESDDEVVDELSLADAEPFDGV